MKPFALTLGTLALILVANLVTVLPTPAHAGSRAPGERRARAAALREACRDDFARLCAGVQPGGGRVVACLREQEADLSSTCHQALIDAGVLNDGSAGDSGAAR